MADDGGWLSGPDEARAARVRFEEVLAEFTRRLASPEPMRRETAVALVQQMERLARRMAAQDEALNGRVADLSAALSALNAKLDTELAAAAAREAQLTARLDRTLVELAEAQAARRPLLGPGAVRLVLAAASLCAVLYGVVVGVAAVTRPEAGGEPAPAQQITSETARETYAPVVTPTLTAAAPPAVIAIDTAPAPSPPASSPRTSLEPFSTVMAALGRGEPTAVRRLTALAGSGDAKAQLQLGRLYEAGDAGLAQDMGAARRWTLRAARGGDRTAMYNAAVFLMEGEGGPQDMREAAVWFRRAAERGVTDAQYNLGLMHEAGQGVEQSPQEARRWLALAAKAGDGAAAAKLAELDSLPGVATADDASVADTQRYLAQKGYYVGPIDGLVSPVLTAAAKAYMRDNPGSAPAL